MKTFALGCAALMLLTATASAGDLAVSQSTLSSMGLGKMKVMSDDDGAAVRGKGTFANVWGSSSANFFGQSSNNNYNAGAAWLGKGSSAGGNSLSAAGILQVNFNAEASFPPLMVGATLGVRLGAGLSGGFANSWAN
jgi:hypothetical protein